MKKFFYIITSFILLVALMVSKADFNNVYAMNEFSSKITVSGTGEVQMIPDTVIVSMGVESTNKILTEAETENSCKINNIINILFDYGIEKENIKTRNFNVFPKYDYNKGQSFIGYQVSNYLDFKTGDIQGVGEIITKLTEAGANCFNGVSFTVEDNELAYRQALEKAIDNAWNKAIALLGEDVELYIQEITEESVYGYRGIYDNYASAKSMSEGATIMEGEIIVKANVRVVFGYNFITSENENENA